MYTEQDCDAITRQYRRAVILWLIPETLLLTGVVISFVFRIQWLTSLLFALLGALVLFSANLYILPLRRYRSFLRAALEGKTRKSVAAFKSFSEQFALRDGVRFIPVIMHVGSPHLDMDERQFYWDRNLPLPDWKADEKIILLTHDKMIVGWEKAARNEALAD